MKSNENPDVVAGRYVVSKLHSTGGMSLVYRALDEETGQEVAVKMLRPELADSKLSQARLIREAEATASVSHVNVVRVLDYSRQLGERPAYIVLELLRGLDLWTLSRRQVPHPLSSIRRFALDACRGLAAIHAKGIVHRDIKPENMVIARERRREVLKLIDLGIAYLPDDPRPFPGMVTGSPGYRSPEQLACCEDLDGRADLWALGVVLYELITDETPYAGSSLDDIERNVMIGAYTPLRRAWRELPRGLDRVIESCLEPDVDDRPGSAEELERELTKVWPADVQEAEAVDDV